MFRANNFDKLLDKATSNLRLDPDWPTILQICDLIRQNDCSPKYAVAAVKKKLYSQNPHQAMFALLVLESVVKNCGSGIHDEVGSKTFCESLRDLVKTTQHENLRSKILELIQAWAFAFRNSNKYRAVQDTVNILKTEGYKFPALKESDAMFSADTAPEWADGEVCHRCRVAFSLMVRRHHCRACGQVFCQQCSSKTSTLPKFGIEKEVRVCDACYDKVSRPPLASTKLDIIDTSSDYGPATQSSQPKRPGGKSAEELQEEEELQLALALSQSEAEQKEKLRRTRTLAAPDPAPLHQTLSPTPSSVSASPEHSGNPELTRYLDRGYWERRLSRDPAAPTAPAPASSAASEVNDTEYAKTLPAKNQDDDAEDKEIDEFVETLKNQVEIFVNRMKSNSSRGRSIANDTSVQTLFMNITAMHSRLLRYIQVQDDKRVYLESLQDKVTQVRDSRAALDTLRAEHAARLAAAAEAAERQRQMQMAAKLQAMRKKKHEYLQYQRQLALQRVQEQEREMQMRQEQQKHQYMMSANSYYIPGAMQQFQQGYPNQPIYANPQFHPQMMPQPTTDGSVPMPGQPQMSQANMMAVNQMGPQISQSMPQNMTNFNTSGMALSQAPMNIPSSINQQTMRSALSQQMPMQQQMMMQQMHQMRMPNQAGMHPMMQQGMPNNLPGQNMPPNGQMQQMPKQNMPNQPQQPNNMMPPMTTGQQPGGQAIMSPSNPMLGMQMQNMRMPMMQGNQPNANQSMPGYPMNMPMQNNQPGQPQSLQQQSQMPLPGQPMSLPNQQMLPNQLPGQSQSMPLPNHAPANQSMPSQGPQGPQQQMLQQSQQQMPQQSQQQIPIQGQPMPPPGQQMMMQGQQVMPQGQNMPPGSQMNQMPHNQIPSVQQSQQMVSGQQMPNTVQVGPMTHQLPPSSQMHGQGPSQAPQMQGGPPGPHGPQGPQGQPMPGQQPIPQAQMSQGQQIPETHNMGQNVQGQPLKIQSQNFANGPPGQPQPPPPPPGQPQPKSEHNNNTAELISFD